MKIALAFALALFAASPALAIKQYLVHEWFENGYHMCKYANGTVLNVGAKVCPLSVEG